MNTTKEKYSQSGFVAIFTVIFFIILTSVLTLGFIRIMIDERRQSTDNDLTASALNAAETGVEDGKRLLLYCENNPTESACDTALTQDKCPGVFGDAGMAALLGVNQESDKSIRVTSTADHEQHYTCLLIKKLTDDYKGTLQANQSDIVPLKATNKFDTIEIAWHLIAEEGSPVGYPAIGSLHNTGDWASGQYPAYMRAQYIEHDSGNINLTDLDEASRHVFLAPASGATALTSVGLNAVDPRPAGNLSPGARAKNQAVPVQCVPAGSVTQTYACTIRIELGADVDPSSVTSYLRIVPLYGATNFRVKLYDGPVPINFDGVQPVIDSTGRSNDVYRRVQARVRMDGAAFYPQFALESGKDLCKDMLVTTSAVSYVDNCYTGPDVCSGGRSDVVLTLDASNSMNKKWESGTRMDKLREVAKIFVNNTEVSDTTNKEAIIKFNDPSSTAVIQGLTGDIGKLESAIDSLTNQKNTFYIPALNVSDQELYGANSRPTAPKVLVFVSDGEPEDPVSGINAKSNAMKAKGVRIYTVGITVSSAADAILTDMAAGNGGRYVKVTSVADLTAAMQQIGDEIGCL